MSDASFPRLRGNTFLLLLLRAANPELSQTPRYGEKGNGKKRSNMLRDLLKMARPSYEPAKAKTLEKYISSFLNGSRPHSQRYYPFKTASLRHDFSSRLDKEYETVLKEMDAFCRCFLDFENNSRMRLLVGGLVETIEADDSISETASFNTGYGEKTRKDLPLETKFVLQPFLLSVWHYIVAVKYDASEGTETYNQWTSKSGDRSPCVVTTDIGRELSQSMVVSTDFSNDNHRDSTDSKESAGSAAEKDDGNPIDVVTESPKEYESIGQISEDLPVDFHSTMGAFSRNYYNLLVYGDTPFMTDGHITMSEERSFKDYTPQKLKERFGSLSEKTIEELKTFPCIVASESQTSKWWEDTERQAIIAKLTDIKERSNGIELYFHRLFSVPQHKLESLCNELAIVRKPFRELTRTHWTVKAIDLMEVLGEADLIPSFDEEVDHTML